jgi:hypothetical protein
MAESTVMDLFSLLAEELPQGGAGRMSGAGGVLKKKLPRFVFTG